MSDIRNENIEEKTATKNVRLNEQVEGESLPLATTADAFSATPSPRGSTPKTPNKLKYIELFSGIGAFHQAITRILPNSECVFAADIDEKCANVYKINYGIESLCDLTKKNEKEIPNHDFCFFSPPCQAFSKGGKQKGFEEARGTLIFEVFRILKEKRPKYILMENVRNLVSHDNGNTIKVILDGLHELGYQTPSFPLILSPHQFGIPQLRERAFLPGIYNPTKVLEPLKINLGKLLKKTDNNLMSILDSDNTDENLRLRKEDEKTIEAWNEFYHGIDIKVIGFPIWADYFFDSTDTTNFPKWKLEFVKKNQNLYKRNKTFIDSWIKKYDIYNSFTPTQRKFEWQAGENIKSVYEGLIQFRPSGMRVKVPNAAPALVAMVQTSVIGKYKRKIIFKKF